jgi:outer membrane receptor protein involved in Fe transport
MFAQSKGTITGTITDKELNNEPLPYANVLIKGTNIGVTTDEVGKYSLTIEPGDYVIQFSFIGYEPAEENVTVKAGETIVVDKALGSGGYTLEDVVIQSVQNREREAALLVEQKNAIEIKQSIGTQEMSRKGVSTVEQGVAKISGVSKVADRGIFIRGLDDRYNYLQINGLNFIPSDPNLKTIPLSYIPTDVVRNLDIYKTFNTSLYQDFAGASLNVLTKDISSKPFTRISISTGYNTLTSLKKFKTSDEGGGDFFGYSGDNRALPTVFNESRATGYTATPAESKDLFKSSWTPDETRAPLSVGTSITNSDTFVLKNDSKLGYIFNMNFSNSYSAQSGERRTLNSAGTASKDFELDSWRYLTQKSALASLNYRKSDKYNFFFNVLYFQNSENSIEEIFGKNDGFPDNFFLRDTKYVENTSLGLQQGGTIFFKDKTNILEYGFAATIGKNNTPDRKTLITEGRGADADFITYNGVNPFRFYSVLDNVNFNGKLEYEIRFGGEEVATKPKHALRFGTNADYTKYDFFNRTIRVNGGGNLQDTSLDTDNPQQFFDENFENGNLFYVSNSDPTYKVEAYQFIGAGFANYTRNWEKFTMDLGLRVEYLFRQTKYRPENATVVTPFTIAEYNPIDFSPVVNLKYAASEKTNIRFTASKTSTKPRFREILPFRYQDGDGSFSIGNPNLINTTNYNVDLKYEFFPTQSSLLAVGAFGKLIDNPITRLVKLESAGPLTYYANFDQGTLYGIELESNFGLDALLAESDFSKRIFFGINAILMRSNEKADANEFGQLTTTDRSLQGASNFIVNADVAYQLIKRESAESRLGLIFNTYTDRIYSVGNSGAADITQKPVHMLDFTWRNTFAKKYQINLTVRNILQSEFLTTQDPTTTVADPGQFSNVNNRLTQGTDIGLEFSYTF